MGYKKILIKEKDMMVERELLVGDPRNGRGKLKYKGSRNFVNISRSEWNCQKNK